MEGLAPPRPRVQIRPRRSGALQFMKLLFAGERILAVMAHPDDAELLCAGTLGRAKGDGAAIGVCVMCRGDKGVASDTTARDLGSVRHEEAKEAVNVLGAELFWFG